MMTAGTMRILSILLCSGALLSANATASCNAADITVSPTGPRMPPPADMAGDRPRLFVLTDIGNEPDDQMSLVRLILYSNDIDIEGLVAGTSVWQKSATHAETIQAIIDAFGQVRPNLLKHAQGWPTAESLSSVIATGQPGYGMASVGEGHSTAGSRALIQAVDRQDARPLWVALWGGANTLAQALFDVRATRSPDQLREFVAKLRIYSISDQDDAGSWIRHNFPGISYIVDPSSQNGDDYAAATWTGIAGDHYYRNGDGADFSTVTNAWLDRNIRAKGPLGKHYLRYMFIMEGDTPSFLNLIGNGLEAFRDPSWGGWGGRYVFRKPHDEAQQIWTQGGDAFARIDSRDTVRGADGRLHISNQATIWRWRTAFQNDFAARMDWTIKPFGLANHAPIAIVNGQAGHAPLFIDGKVGHPIVLDAGRSHDPDRQPLRYHWFLYSEAGYSPGVTMAQITLAHGNMSRAVVTPLAACRPQWLAARAPCGAGTAQVILAVSDNGRPSLTSYRRIIVRVSPPTPRLGH